MNISGYPLDRRHWFRLVLPSGLAVLFSGCEALDELDTSAAAEGTGIQFSAVITVLARYRANPSQRQKAAQRGGTAYVKSALEPAYKKRRTELSKKVPSAPDAGQTLAALDQAWYETAVAASRDAYKPEVSLPQKGTVAFATIEQEKAVLMADARRYVPNLIAVNVPAAGHPSEAKAAGSVMFWNPSSLDLASGEVYVLATRPTLGKVAKFESLQAVYKGDG